IPFIDFLLCVVVFLLMTFATSPDSAFSADLPEAANGAELTFAPVISVARDNWALLHEGEPFPGRVIVQVDRSVDFRAVRKVLFSAGQAGYPDVDLAVRSAP